MILELNVSLEIDDQDENFVWTTFFEYIFPKAFVNKTVANPGGAATWF